MRTLALPYNKFLEPNTIIAALILKKEHALKSKLEMHYDKNAKSYTIICGRETWISNGK